MLEQEVVGCSMKQLSGRGNSKAHCCLSILRITPNHSQKNEGIKKEANNAKHLLSKCVGSG